MALFFARRLPGIFSYSCSSALVGRSPQRVLYGFLEAKGIHGREGRGVNFTPRHPLKTLQWIYIPAKARACKSSRQPSETRVVRGLQHFPASYKIFFFVKSVKQRTRVMRSSGVLQAAWILRLGITVCRRYTKRASPIYDKSVGDIRIEVSAIYEGIHRQNKFVGDIRFRPKSPLLEHSPAIKPPIYRLPPYKPHF